MLKFPNEFNHSPPRPPDAILVFYLMNIVLWAPLFYAATPKSQPQQIKFKKPEINQWWREGKTDVVEYLLDAKANVQQIQRIFFWHIWKKGLGIVKKNHVVFILGVPLFRSFISIFIIIFIDIAPGL